MSIFSTFPAKVGATQNCLVQSYRCKCHLNSLPNNKFLDCYKLKEFADDNFKFDVNGRKLSKQVENTVGKGEIARYEQFLLFPQCFQKACFPEASKGVIVWEWVNAILEQLNWSYRRRNLYQNKAWE